MKTLFLIPARAGSKGIVKKNIRLLGDKPLIIHSLMLARQFASDTDICISTDDPEVISVAAKENYQVPFKRPDEIAGDTTGMREVMLHALNYYSEKGVHYDRLVLLQPTSPFRQPENLKEGLELYNENIDMVVSVTETKANPYFVLYEEDHQGLLAKSKQGNFKSRQDCPKVWQLNGAIYVINVKSLIERPVSDFTRIKKIVMDQLHSVDLDTEIDWKLATIVNEEHHLV